MAIRAASNVVPIRRGRTGSPCPGRQYHGSARRRVRLTTWSRSRRVVAALCSAVRRSGRSSSTPGASTSTEDAAGWCGIDHRLGIAERHACRAHRRRADRLRDAAARAEHPEIVVVAGDDDLVVAAAMAAAKQGIAVAHLGAGLRCHDWTAAGRGQPHGHRPALGHALHRQRRRSPEPARGGRAGRPHPLRRQHARRRAAPLRGARPHARRLGGARRRRSTRYTLGRAAPPGELRGRRPRSSTSRPRSPSSRAQRRRADARARRDASRCSTRARPRAAASASGVSTVAPAGYLESLSLHAGAGAIVTDAGSRPGGRLRARRPLLHAAQAHAAHTRR